MHDEGSLFFVYSLSEH